MKGCPSRLDDDASPALQPKQHGGEIFHVEGFLRVHVALAPVGFTKAAGSELRMRRRGDGGHVELLHQMQRGIDEMHAQIADHAAAGELPAREPRADAGDARATQPERPRMVNLAEVAALDDGARGLRVFVEAKILRDHERAFHGLRRLDHLRGFLGIEGHRFFHEHVLARLERVDGDGRVEMVRQGDGDGVDVRLLQQLAVVGVAAGDVVPDAGLAGAVRVVLRQGHRRRAMTSDE